MGRVRVHAEKAIQGIIAIGEDLLAVKEALPHGKFGSWLEAEFGWKERTARNFMAVATLFGPKSATIADLAVERSDPRQHLRASSKKHRRFRCRRCSGGADGNMELCG